MKANISIILTFLEEKVNNLMYNKNVKAIKVKIYPRKWQKELIEKHFGCCRVIYNYGLETKSKTYTETKKSISVYQIQKDIPKMYEEKPWLKEVNAQSLQQTLKDLDSAFSHFFKKNNKFPKFKSKHNPKQSFRVPQYFEISKDKKHIKLPKLKWIRFIDKFNAPEDCAFKNITVSREGTEYYASICYDEGIETPQPSQIKESKTLGIDLGTTHLAIFSDDTKIDNPKHFKKYEDKLAKEQQILSKKNKDTKVYQKQKEKVRRIHKKIRSQRKDFLHKLTTSLVKNQDWTSYAMEDLAVKEMEQENFAPMSKAIGDAGWRMFRQMMEYKCEDSGKNLLVIGRFEPSSKRCSVCGHIYQKLKREEKEWECSSCGTNHDRDINAANNIKQFALIKSLGKDFISERKLEPHGL
ncbi:MAG: RNA-guided endonuclease TnpB family protein [Synergistaceae bacterium]